MEEIVITVEHAQRLYGVLMRLSGPSAHPSYQLMLLRNLRELERGLKSAEDKFVTLMSTDFPDYKEYNEERISICEQYAQLDDNGKPIEKDQRYAIDPKQKDTFNTALKELQEKYPKVVAEVNARKATSKEILAETVMFKLRKLSSKDIPDTVKITQADTERLECILED